MAQEIGWTEKVAKEWRSYKSPSRPSLSEAKIYESHIRKLPKNSKILILGSTPELRDLAAKYRMDVTVIDWSEEIYRALGLIMKKKGYPETFHKHDWRGMKFDDKFDMVIGDCATTVVPFKDLEVVLQNIATNLKPDGIAMQRIWVRYKGQQYTLKSIVRAFKNKGRMYWYTRMLFPVFLHYYDAESESLSGQRLYECLKKDESKLPKNLVDLFALVQNHKTPNNVLLRNDMESLLKKYFEIVRIEHGRDIFRNNALIYVLRKK